MEIKSGANATVKKSTSNEDNEEEATEVPENVDVLRSKTILYMVANKKDYYGSLDCPMDEEGFNNLIHSQSKLDAWTDDDGFMVLSVCRYLNVQLKIIVTNIQSNILLKD